MSAALLDRLTHRANILEFRGTSYRFRQQLKRSESEPASQPDFSLSLEVEPTEASEPTLEPPLEN